MFNICILLDITDKLYAEFSISKYTTKKKAL
jgi:hypothetical protein